MTTLRTSATLPTVAMRSTGDFEAMWREMVQTNKRVWTIAHKSSQTSTLRGNAHGVQ